jgi:hypothetical protein
MRLRPVTLSLTPRHLHVAAEGTERTLRWNLGSEVVDRPDAVLLFWGPLEALIVPRRTLESLRAEEFARLAHRYLTLAQST